MEPFEPTLDPPLHIAIAHYKYSLIYYYKFYYFITITFVD